MWNNAAFSSSSSSSSRINTDYNLSSFMEGGVGGESSNLRSPNEYEKLFLNEWFTSPYSKDGAVLHSEMEFSSLSLLLSPLPLTSNGTSVGEREGMMKSVGLNSEETQIITSQAVSGNEDSNLRIAKRLKPTCTEKQAHKSPLEASEKQPKAQVKRSQKLGHKITVLQQLVCPFGKTDTASVLSETALCIKYLHDQIKILTAPYMAIPCYQQALIDRRNELHKRGLCLVPISPAIVNLASQLSFDKNLPTKIAPRSKFEF